MKQVARTPQQLGAIIRRARRNMALSQAELGEKTGLWQETISKVESGQSAARIGTILDLLAALNLEIEVQPRGKGSAADIEDAF